MRRSHRSHSVTQNTSNHVRQVQHPPNHHSRLLLMIIVVITFSCYYVVTTITNPSSSSSSSSNTDSSSSESSNQMTAGGGEVLLIESSPSLFGDVSIYDIDDKHPSFAMRVMKLGNDCILGGQWKSDNDTIFLSNQIQSAVAFSSPIIEKIKKANTNINSNSNNPNNDDNNEISMLIIGVGTGDAPRLIESHINEYHRRYRRPLAKSALSKEKLSINIRTDAVELNPIVLDYAQKYFHFHSNTNNNNNNNNKGRLIVDDGRSYLFNPSNEQRYDIIIQDVFDGSAVTTMHNYEIFSKIHSSYLSKNGIYVLNVFTDRTSLVAHYIYKTLSTIFPHIRVYADAYRDPRLTNLIYFCSNEYFEFIIPSYISGNRRGTIEVTLDRIRSGDETIRWIPDNHAENQLSKEEQKNRNDNALKINNTFVLSNQWNPLSIWQQPVIRFFRSELRRIWKQLPWG